jgi:hypothetical protein
LSKSKESERNLSKSKPKVLQHKIKTEISIEPKKECSLEPKSKIPSINKTSLLYEVTKKLNNYHQNHLKPNLPLKTTNQPFTSKSKEKKRVETEEEKYFKKNFTENMSEEELKKQNEELMHQIKQGLNENYKNFFNFSYENFLDDTNNNNGDNDSNAI